MEKHLSIVVTEAFADEIIQDLISKKAVHVVEEDNEATGNEVPHWQQEEVMRRMEDLKKNPTNVFSWKEVKKMLEEDQEM